MNVCLLRSCLSLLVIFLAIIYKYLGFKCSQQKSQPVCVCVCVCMCVWYDLLIGHVYVLCPLSTSVCEFISCLSSCALNVWDALCVCGCVCVCVCAVCIVVCVQYYAKVDM